METGQAFWRIPAMALCITCLSVDASAQARVEKNVVYGMYSGSALLLDVHYPARPNGFGIIFIAGSGWTAPLGYSARPLKESSQVEMYVPSLTDAGYTVFALTHRATPTFRYPAPAEDVHRAVRFVRYNAMQYHVDPARLGGFGGSSGAHLIGLVTTMDGLGDPDDPDPINRVSSKLQCTVARAGPFDLLRMTPSIASDMLALFLGVRPDAASKTSVEYKTAWTASPINYVSKDDGPMLLVHGDADRTVPFHQSELMESALRAVGVPVRLIRIEGADHGPDFPGAKNPPDYKSEMVKWFEHLRR